jgi:WD40 repeat protein
MSSSADGPAGKSEQTEESAPVYGRISAAIDTIYWRYDPKDFVGREWLLQKIAQFRDAADGRHLIIVGNPGAGKSALLAYLAETWNCPRHFVRADNKTGIAGLDAKGFLISVGAQLYQKYGSRIFPQSNVGTTRVTAALTRDKAEVIGRLIDELHTLPFLPVPEHDVDVRAGITTSQARVIGERINRLVADVVMLDVTALLQATLLNPLRALHELYANERVLLLVDALDESFQHSNTPITEAIPAASDADFPPNLRILMTSRRGSFLTRFRSQDVLFLDDKDAGYHEKNMQDARQYLEREAARRPLKDALQAWPTVDRRAFLAELEAKSDGNFLYLYYVCTVAAKTLTSDPRSGHALQVPKDLDEVYKFFALERIRGGQRESLTLTLSEPPSDNLVAECRALEGVDQVTVTGDQMLILTESVDALQGRVFRAVYRAGLDVSNSTSQRKIEIGLWESTYLPVLGILGVMYEPITRRQLSEFAGVSPAIVDTICWQMEQFLEVTSDEEPRSQLYHRDFADYLVDPARNIDFRLDGPTHHLRIAHYFKNGAAYWRDVDWGTVHDDYAFRHLAAHLIGAGGTAELRELLLGFGWLKAKLEAAGVTPILDDYAAAPSDPSCDLVRDAVRTSAHVLAFDARQLAGQLLGRLLSEDDEEIRQLVARATRSQEGPWLRPLRATLRPPRGPLKRTLADHSPWIRALAMCPDGRTLAAAHGKILKFWNIETGRELRTPDQAGTEVGESLAIDAEGRRLVSTWSGGLTIWDVESRSAVAAIPGHRVGDVTVSPNGRYAVTESGEGFEMWDLDRGQRVHSLPQTPRGNMAVVLPDGQRVFTAAWTDRLAVWDLTSGKQLRRLGRKLGLIHTMAVSPDGRRAVSSSSGIGSDAMWLDVWDLERERHVGRIRYAEQTHRAVIGSLALLHDGKRFVTGTRSGLLQVWSIDSLKLMWTVDAHLDQIDCITATFDDHLVTASFDGRSSVLQVWDVSRQEDVPAQDSNRHEESVSQIVQFADGESVMTVSASSARLWDVATGLPRAGFTPPAGSAYSVALVPPGDRLLSVGPNRTLKLWDLASGSELKAWHGDYGRSFGGVIVSSDGRWAVHNVFVDGGQEGYFFGAYVWDLDSGKVVRSQWDNADVAYAGSLVMLPDDSRVLTASSRAARITEWRLRDGEVIGFLSPASPPRDGFGLIYGRGDGFVGMQIAAGGQRVVAASGDGCLRIWDLASRAEIASWFGLGRITALGLFTDGRHAVVGGWENWVRIVDLEEQRVVCTFTAESTISACAASLDGNTIIAGEETGAVHVLKFER